MTNTYVNTLNELKTRIAPNNPINEIIDEIIGILENPDEYATRHYIESVLIDIGATDVSADTVQAIMDKLTDKERGDRGKISETTIVYAYSHKLLNTLPVKQALIDRYPDILFTDMIRPDVRVAVLDTYTHTIREYTHKVSTVQPWSVCLDEIENGINGIHKMHAKTPEKDQLISIRITNISDIFNKTGLVNLERENVTNDDVYYQMPYVYVRYGNRILKDILTNIANAYVDSDTYPKPDKKTFTWNDFDRIPQPFLKMHGIERVTVNHQLQTIQDFLATNGIEIETRSLPVSNNENLVYPN